jgi:filamentous hemagglutinin family protein
MTNTISKIKETASLLRVSSYASRSPSLFRRFLAAFLIYLVGGFPTLLYAAPTGGSIVSGTGTITDDGSGNVLINQTSDKLIIDWNSFSIDTAQSVTFTQPNAASQALNNVIGLDPSIIAGALIANGQIFLVNTNGIIIKPTANIDVGALIMSTLNISNQDFLDDIYKFTQDTGKVLGVILNEGTVRAADFVAMIAPAVQNKGVVLASLGSVGMASGEQVTLDFVGDGLINFTINQAVTGTVLDKDGNVLEDAILNSGSIQANGGQVMLTALNASDVIKNVVNNTGIIEANTVVNKGGKIFLMGNGNVNMAGSITAKGDDAGENGGEITIDAVSATIDNGTLDVTSQFAQGGAIDITGTSWVSLGGLVNASGVSGGSVTVNAGGLSIAAPVLARGTTGDGGSINLTTLFKSWENTDGVLDVSGANGGSIRHIASQQITTSATYLAVGSTGVGGSIDVSAPALKFLSTQINASGFTGGGTIRLGGEFQGGKNLTVDEMPNAQILAMTDATTVKADTLGTDGDGGTIITWADQTTSVLGQFSALPGTNSGSGGFVEVSSGNDSLTFGGTIVSGIGSREGTVLLDPKNIVVGDNTFSQYSLIIGFNYANINADGLSLGADDEFGSVSLDGNRLAVGAAGDDASGGGISAAGAVYLFSFTDSNFGSATLQAIIGSGYSGGKNFNQTLEFADEFGVSVSLDGNRLAVGARGDDGTDASGDEGAVYLYTFADENFTGTALAARIGAGYNTGNDLNNTELQTADAFGGSVSLDGNRLAVGSYLDDGSGVSGGLETGAVFLYTFADSAFTGGALAAIIGKDYTGGKNINQDLDGDQFGFGVSLDGNRLAVGAFKDDGFNNANADSGAVYLYTFTDSIFTGGTLTATIGSGYTGGKDINQSLDTGDAFGISVSLDGNRLAVGANSDGGANNNCSGCGAAYLFTFTDSAFSGGSLEATIGNGYTGGSNINVSLDASDNFARSLSLDGNRLAVGALIDDGADNATNNVGSVYLFTFSDSAFSGGSLANQLGSGYSNNLNLNQELDASDQFGRAVSLDGTSLAVGVQFDDGVIDGGTDFGAVYLYTFADSAFNGGTLQAIIGSGYTGGKNIDQALDASDIFGQSVSLDANRLAVGAVFDDGSGGGCVDCGAVYLYTFTDSSFSGGALAATIGSGYAIDPGALETTDRFGESVSLDGNRLAIGSVFDDGATGTQGLSGDDEGAVYLYTFTTSSFAGATLAAKIGEGATGGNNINQALDLNDQFGIAVSLDGNQLIVGAYLDDGFGNAVSNAGAAYIFSFTDSSFTGGTQEAIIGSGYTGGKNINQTLEVDDRFGIGISLDASRLAIGAYLDDGFGNIATDSGAVYLYTFTDTAFSGGSLSATIGHSYTGGNNIDVTLDGDDQFGISVSLDGSRMVVGAIGDDGADNTCTNCGNAYFFTFADDTFSGGSQISQIGSGYGNASLSQNLDTGDTSGRAVSLDGTQLAIGVPGDDGFGIKVGGLEKGAVYLYTFADSLFNGGSLQAIIGDGYTGGKNVDQSLDSGDLFGVSLSLDANRLAVGAQSDDGSSGTCNNCGAVYLYSFTDSTFAGGALAATIGSGYSTGKDLNNTLLEASGDQFGISVSLDGNRLAVGANDDDGSGNGVSGSGAVYLYTFTDAAFSSGTLAAIIGDSYSNTSTRKDINQALDISDEFGYSVSLDGNRLAVGANTDDGSGGSCTSNCGAVYLYTFTDSTFSTVGSLAAIIGDNYTNTSTRKDINQSLDNSDEFGVSVSLDGNRLAVGARQDGGVNNATSGAGAVYLYTFSDSTFSTVGTLEAKIGSGYSGTKDIHHLLDTGDQFGTAVSLDGNRLVVGSAADDGQTNIITDTGSVYLYTFTDSVFSGGALAGIIGAGYAGGKNINQNLDASDQFGGKTSLDGLQLAVGVALDDGSGGGCVDCGAVYLYTFKDSNFSGGALQSIIGSAYTGGKNINQALDGSDQFGHSVSLDGNRLAVGSQKDDGSGASGSLEYGAVYLYTFTDSIFSGGSLAATIGVGYSTGKDVTQNLDNGDEFGTSVSLDGTQLAVGAIKDDGAGASGALDYGAVYLYTFSDTAFNGGVLTATFGLGYNTGKDRDPGSLDTSDFFGGFVSLDNNRLAISATSDAGFGLSTAIGKGAVYLYTFADSVFSTGTLAATIGDGYVSGNDIDISLDNFDSFSRLSLDGNRLAVGASGDDGFGNSNTDSGAVYLFTFTDSAFNGGALAGTMGSGYTGGKNLDVNLDSNDAFGISVSLDGNRLVTTALSDDGLGNVATDTGAVYLYTFGNDTFGGGQLAGIIGEGYSNESGGQNVTLEANDQFGFAVSLDGENGRVIMYQ